MSALARLLKGIGADVSGSDKVGNSVVSTLLEQGIKVWTGHQVERLHGENGYVIRSAAVPPTDPEVRECERRGFTSLLYAESVGRLSEGKETLAIAGTHGKTTTTALTVAALRGAGLDPSHLIGGEVPELGGNGHGGRDDVFVVEACEFNRSFHELSPFGAAVLNLDHDHFDCYPSADDLIDAFAAYVARVRPGGTVLVEESVPATVVDTVCRDVQVQRVGSGLFADIRALEIRDELGCYSFVPLIEGRRLPRIDLNLPGRFQVQNALVALGLALLVGAEPAGACEGLSNFAGVRRRFELHTGDRGGCLVNDYAHHPGEIRAVIRAARRRFPGRRLLVAFQPHQHQRTKHLLEEFAETLALADYCLVAEIYGARESAQIRNSVSAADLVAGIRELGTPADCGGEVEVLPRRILEERGDEDLLLILGAGDIDLVVDDLVAAI